LIIGNPPWVTNSSLSVLNSGNLPKKNNFCRLKGFDAKTGKSNFDIAEWMLIKLIESLPIKKASRLAMLCKTSTARKVLKYFWQNNNRIDNSSIHLIDAKKHFNISADACLFVTSICKSNKNINKSAYIYGDLSFTKEIRRFGISNNDLVADMDGFDKYKSIDGANCYKWRSGIKHDAIKVMELVKDGDSYKNGFGEIVSIEPNYIFPLLKSSDLSNNRLIPSKYMIVTQKKINKDTSAIKTTAPNTWNYLIRHSQILDNRKSRIYKKHFRFSIFGVGAYSFSKWKVAVSGFHKKIFFRAVGSYNNKPIMLDDTCYFFPCYSKKQALFIEKLLNSKACLNFLESLIFFDAKRPVTIDILKRIDLIKLSEVNGRFDTILKHPDYFEPYGTKIEKSLFKA